MKQDLDIQQIEELSESSREKLLQWCLAKRSKEIGLDDVMRYREVPSWVNNNLCRYMTIGKMIEFLVENTSEFPAREENIPLWFYHAKWHNNVCDTLWEAVKEILEK